MTEESTAATADGEEVTGQPGEPTQAERNEQENAAKLEEIQASLRELTERYQLETTARAEAEQKAKKASKEAERLNKQYTGLQRETTGKMQELALLRQALNNQEITSSKLSRMEKLVSELATTSLDPERVRQINQEIEAEQNRGELERLRQEAESRSRPPTLTPQYKEQLKEAYFRKFTTVDASELTDDEWRGLGANDPVSWEANVRSVFERRAEEKAERAQPVVDPKAIAAEFQAQVDTRIKALQEEESKKSAESAAKIQQLEEELVKQKRLTEESLNRARGMDRTDSTGGEPPTKTSKDLAAIPDSWLYGTADQKKAYREALNNPKLRDAILRDARDTGNKQT